jgi:hypothetical protein
MNSVLQAFVHAPGKYNTMIHWLTKFEFQIVLRDCFLSEKQHDCQSKDTNHTINNCIMCQLRRLYHHVS